MHEITSYEFSKLFLLFSGWDHHMAIRAAAEGKARSRVWVDFDDSPTAAAVSFGVRLLIAGDSQNIACRDAIVDFVQNAVLQNQIERMRHFVMIFWDEPGWKEVLPDSLEGYNPILREREYYRQDMANIFNNPALPAGYELRRVDSSFLNEREWRHKSALQYEMCSERVSLEDFLEHSFGVCAVQGDEIAGWCLSEYNNSSGCEVGIELLESHQRKGIGTALTLALFSEARKRGLPYVGWSCFKDNLPSRATARKAGLSKVKDYQVIVVQR